MWHEAHETHRVIWTRTVEIGKKLALVHACSRNYNGVRAMHPDAYIGPVITLEDMKWGMELSIYSAMLKSTVAYDFISENETQKKQKRFIQELKKHGKMSKSSLARKTQFVKKPERDEIIRSLLEQGLIQTGEEDGLKYYEAV